MNAELSNPQDLEHQIAVAEGARHERYERGDHDGARSAFSQMVALIHKRTPERVREMEMELFGFDVIAKLDNGRPRTYSELLKDPRWQRKRLEVMQAANFACEKCECKTVTLHVHHTVYRRGLMPWEYQRSELCCLCKDCHAATHGLDIGVRYGRPE